MPTGNLESGASQSKNPLTGAQADAAGTEPEFRWPARGRIIQGFKSGGNDGINISVPSGTSVRAAESGTVVYRATDLKATATSFSSSIRTASSAPTATMANSK